MKIRRCAVVYFESREDAAFSLESILQGGDGLVRTKRWLALAAHLDEETEVSPLEMALLGTMSAHQWISSEQISFHPEELVVGLLQKGLLVSDGRKYAAHQQRDESIRSVHWWPAAALMQRLSRWRGLDSAAAMEAGGMATAADLCAKLGAPPSENHSLTDPSRRVPLARQAGNSFDALLARRSTCRNFDQVRSVSGELLSHMLQRVLMAQALVRVENEATFLKKNVPSGGGLHPTEAYLIVQNVDGIAPGIYHYHPVDHALEPMAIEYRALPDLSREALAGQYWFSNAPVLMVLTTRFERSFWKYRRHAKAYRATILDVGHIAQTLYLSATELGLGAFVTSAINEVDIEMRLGLNPMEEGVMAICGFGWRADHMETSEFDPLHEVWIEKQA
ncbi:putative peptide maturation dehydrogenase [Xanthomonas hyacinthi]|uniref:Putative peptide maturation dehydrogenase n=1 Tax=Xanthomonas hyacinthi TaxID=56455 RepID=A0A2S7EPS7_9XANT|nr:putative peptide maturation dehydrogenase [Xanthomonas hyacinthi]KLD78532.1 dehydrogenase [Xanthomonas hyacinthi DSM 19077]PPU94822.1 putative peptide maturation dehydrogenase [Xanthomonas hyacinthi]QGY76947.1 putative peptide maturation dehydrogenase [Xanthomonas hyacinthi]